MICGQHDEASRLESTAPPCFARGFDLAKLGLPQSSWPGSIRQDSVGRRNELILLRAVVVGGRVVRVLIAQFRPDQAGVLSPCIEPMSPSEAVGAVSCLCARTLSARVIEILVAHD